MPDWSNGPQWRNQGRTGPGPFAPRYSNRKDRSTVRRGGTPGGGGNKPPKGGCAVVAIGAGLGLATVGAAALKLLGSVLG